ncbi:MAG TPA: hypothetical protein PKH78_05310, partial [Candidatus Obscuribacter sp.]|nr:hypothetical protein [Candidatus Obscuribacter sp.]
QVKEYLQVLALPIPHFSQFFQSIVHGKSSHIEIDFTLKTITTWVITKGKSRWRRRSPTLPSPVVATERTDWDGKSNSPSSQPKRLNLRKRTQLTQGFKAKSDKIRIYWT